MSGLFDDPSLNVPAVSPRARFAIWATVVVIGAFIALTTFAGVWTDHLWFDAIGYDSVFTTVLWIKVVLFVIFAVVTAGALMLTLWLAWSSRPFLHPVQIEAGMERYRDAVNPIKGWLWLGLSVVAGLFVGASAASRWQVVELWRHQTKFGQKDPYFGKDVSFYVFELPFLHLLVGSVLAITVLCLIGSLLVHYVYGGIRLQSVGDRISGPAQAQFSVLLAVLVLVKGADYWLDRYDLTSAASPLFTGVGYTDDHAVLPAKSALAGIAVICAVLFIVNLWRRTWLLPGMGVALWAVSSILLGLIWPAIVQTIQVNPSKQDKENSYQATNIAQTRVAYAIDDKHVTVSDYTESASLGRGQEGALAADTSSAPVMDPFLVHDLFEEMQQARKYYTVAPVLDVDRYDMNGADRALVLGVRELSQTGLDAKDQNWSNLHTVYTHGSGVIAAYANQRPLDDKASSASADVQWAEGNEASQNDLVTAGPGKYEQRVYFGEQSPTYSVVGRPLGASSVELDLAASGTEDEDATTTYDGNGGVPIGSTWRRLLYAIKFGSPNFLLSERVNANSQVLYDRTPAERVKKVAPWLTLDNDPYPVVANGRILWVIDGYTTTNRYPGSQSESFKTMTNDALAAETGLRAIPTDEINYMRNAVKATVDAYDGTVTLYGWDESDPIMQTWSKVFPGTVQPKSSIPDWLLPHLRYPEDLFKVQRYQLAKYHVTDATTFLQGSDWWQVPIDPNSSATGNAGLLQAPSRLFLDRPGTDEQMWSLTSSFSPNGRNNLSAIMTVDSDASNPETYGRISVLERPDQQTQGPRQVVANMKNDATIGAALLPYKGTSGVLNYGGLLTIPTSGHGLVYLLPVYAKQTTTSPYPVLAYILASYNGNIGYGRTLTQALASALSGSAPSVDPVEPGPSGGPSGTASPSPSASPSTPELPASAKALLAEAQRLFTEAEAAGRAGDFARREELLKKAEAKVAAALLALDKG